MRKSSITDMILLRLLSLVLLFKGYFGNPFSLNSNNINMLLNEKEDYDGIHGLLFSWLKLFSKESHERSVVVRLLGDAKDIKYTVAFLDEYINSQDLYYKFVLANSIYMINLFSDDLLNKIMKLALKKSDNNARYPFLLYLFNSKNNNTREVLEKIKNDVSETSKMRETAKQLLNRIGPIPPTYRQKLAIIAME